MDERALVATLVEIGARLDHPVPTRMREGVRARIAERRAARAARAARPALVPAALTAILVALAVALASPQVRAAAADLLRLGGIDIFRVPSPPTAPASPTASLVFPGELVTLEQARRRTSMPIAVPAALGEPDAVYVEAIPGGERVTLVYLAGHGLPTSSLPPVTAVVVELRGVLERAFMAKAVGPGTTVDDVTVNDEPGLWLAGAPHLLFYRDATGQVREETLRLAGNTLLWQRGDVTVRLEAQITRDEALRIASSSK